MNTTRALTTLTKSLATAGLVSATIALAASASGCSADGGEALDVSESAQTSGRRVPSLPHLPPGVEDFYDGGCVDRPP
ncbi:MAG: hypothetical protein KF894_22520, partial [Labilithrix sp.]|nr:hypothetical protein [Labilithrix sp.]